MTYVIISSIDGKFFMDFNKQTNDVQEALLFVNPSDAVKFCAINNIVHFRIGEFTIKILDQCWVNNVLNTFKRNQKVEEWSKELSKLDPEFVDFIRKRPAPVRTE